MRLLLDTQLLLWVAGGLDRLSVAALQLLNDPRHELLFSAASVWEIAIKRMRDRADFHVEPPALRRNLLVNGYVEMPVASQHALAILNLPQLHKDPFDRLLLAQAISEGMLLVTADAQLARYPGPVRLV